MRECGTYALLGRTSSRATSTTLPRSTRTMPMAQTLVGLLFAVSKSIAVKVRSFTGGRS
jgi:hypothetical protein